MYYSPLYYNNRLQTPQSDTNNNFGFSSPYENTPNFNNNSPFDWFSNFSPIASQVTDDTNIPLNDAFLWQPLLTELTDVFDLFSGILSTQISEPYPNYAGIQVENDVEENNNNGKMNNKKNHDDHGKNDKDDKHGKDNKNDKHGGSHGDYTNEMLGIIDDLEEKGINIKEPVKDAYAKGKDDINGRKVRGNENRDIRSLMDDQVKSAAEDTMKQISKYIEKNPNDTEFLDTVADWIKLGLHDGHDNKNNVGTHALASAQGKGGLAFQLAHFMNAGNDTIIGQKLRGKLENFDGKKLKEFIDDNGGNFFNLFKSQGETDKGEDAEGNEGDFSSMWGASGNASSDVDKKREQGHRQATGSGYTYSQQWA